MVDVCLIPTCLISLLLPLQCKYWLQLRVCVNKSKDINLQVPLALHSDRRSFHSVWLVSVPHCLWSSVIYFNMWSHTRCNLVDCIALQVSEPGWAADCQLKLTQHDAMLTGNGYRGKSIATKPQAIIRFSMIGFHKLSTIESKFFGYLTSFYGTCTSCETCVFAQRTRTCNNTTAVCDVRYMYRFPRIKTRCILSTTVILLTGINLLTGIKRFMKVILFQGFSEPRCQLYMTNWAPQWLRLTDNRIIRTGVSSFLVGFCCVRFNDHCRSLKHRYCM